MSCFGTFEIRTLCRIRKSFNRILKQFKALFTWCSLSSLLFCNYIACDTQGIIAPSWPSINKIMKFTLEVLEQREQNLVTKWYTLISLINARKAGGSYQREGNLLESAAYKNKWKSMSHEMKYQKPRKENLYLKQLVLYLYISQNIAFCSC